MDTVKKLASRNNLLGVSQFNTEKRSAGRYWLKKFLKRNQKLSVRTAEATSIARASGFNKKSVDNFFDIYIPIIEEFHLTANKIYNMDETSLSTVQKPDKIVAKSQTR